MDEPTDGDHIDGLSRRDLLGAGAVGLGVSLAGCAGPMHLGRTDVDAPDRTDDEGETHFTFEWDDDELVTLSLGYGEGYRESANQYPFRVTAAHPGGTRLNGLSLHLYRANRDQQFSEFYLQTPGGVPWPEMTFQRDRDARGVRLDVPDLGSQGSGTVTLEFLVRPESTPSSSDPFVLGFDATVRLSQTSPLGRDFRAQVTDEVEFPTP